MRPDLQGLIPSIYDAALEPDRWSEVAAGLASFIGVNSVLLSYLRLDTPWIGQTWAHGLDPALVADWLCEDVVAHSVYARASLIAPEGCIMDLRMAGGGRLLTQDPGVVTLLAPLDLLEGCGGAVLRDGGMLSGIACFNETRRGELDRETFARIDAVLPHLRRAMAIRTRMDGLRSDRRVLHEALGRLAVGIAVLAADLRILYANPEAERVLAEADGMRRACGRLRLDDPAAGKAIAAAVRRGRASGLQDTFLYVPRPSGKPALTVCIGPASASPPAHRSAAVTLYLSDPASPSVLPPACRLAARFGLTEAEAEVARLAASGLGMPAAANALGVSLNTVRTHLKAVYGKTDTHSRAALVRLFEASFPPVRQHGS